MSYDRPPKFDGSGGSRSSWGSTGSIPIHTETGEINRALPKIPLRVPAKNPRRSLPNGDFPARLPALYIPPVSAAYVPPSPSCKEDKSPFNAPRTESHSTGLSTPTAFKEVTEVEKNWNESRQSKCKFLVLVGVMTAIIIGLAVGLSVGLRNITTGSTSNSPNNPSASGLIFPAGSFSFETSLRENTADCTSRASTWRCHPDAVNGHNTFRWSINSINSYTYTISSGENPAMPAFSNINMKLLDGNQPTERLFFELVANKTVIPADAMTASNRAASCTYPNTIFNATLWTRRRGKDMITPPKDLSQFGTWPGDVEIYQTKNSTIGEPTCVDKTGLLIADVQAGGSTCSCRYV